jgi:TPR repeat protein
MLPGRSVIDMRTRTLIVLLSVALFGCSKKKDDAESLRTACEEKSDLKACNSLARSHFEGVGAPEDKDRAILLFDRACSGGYTNGCENLNVLAGLYAQGGGVPKDSAKAADLYQKACKGGVTAACGR